MQECATACLIAVVRGKNRRDGAEGDGLKADEAGHDGEHGRQVVGREHNVQSEEQRKHGQIQTEGSPHDGTQKSDLCQASPR